ncbi:hypothetical protein, partial [Dyella sp.]|uniref:hypothetical protein n=1 Tax=Dyella sp. TaxID=1869338 RepID=UPI002ED0DA00
KGIGHVLDIFVHHNAELIHGSTPNEEIGCLAADSRLIYPSTDLFGKSVAMQDDAAIMKQVTFSNI